MCVCTQHSQHHTPPALLRTLFSVLPRAGLAVPATLPGCHHTYDLFLEDAPRPPRHSHPSWHKVAHTVPLAYGTRRLRWSGEEYGCWRVLVLVYLFTVQLGPKAQTECDGARLSTTTGHAFATVLPPGPATCFPQSCVKSSESSVFREIKYIQGTAQANWYEHSRRPPSGPDEGTFIRTRLGVRPPIL